MADFTKGEDSLCRHARTTLQFPPRNSPGVMPFTPSRQAIPLVLAAGVEAAMSAVVIDVDRFPCLVGQSGREVTNNPLNCAGHQLEPIPRSLAPVPGRGRATGGARQADPAGA